MCVHDCESECERVVGGGLPESHNADPLSHHMAACLGRPRVWRRWRARRRRRVPPAAARLVGAGEAAAAAAAPGSGGACWSIPRRWACRPLAHPPRRPRQQRAPPSRQPRHRARLRRRRRRRGRGRAWPALMSCWRCSVQPSSATSRGSSRSRRRNGGHSRSGRSNSRRRSSSTAGCRIGRRRWQPPTRRPRRSRTLPRRRRQGTAPPLPAPL